MVLARLLDEISGLPDHHRFGRVTGVLGMLLEVGGAASTLTIGGRCDIVAKGDRRVPCEVVGFREGKALVMPFGALDGIGLGSMAEMAEETAAIFPCEAWLGRVVNAMGEPVDGKGPLPKGPIAYPIRNRPPPAHQRGRVQGKVDPSRL